MLKTLIALAGKVFQIGSLGILLCLPAKDYPITTAEQAKTLTGLAYILTFLLALIPTGNVMTATFMLVAAFLTMAITRRRYSPATTAVMSCMMIVFMLGYVLIAVAIPTGAPFKIHLFAGWIAAYYLGAFRLLRNDPQGGVGRTK